MWTYQLDGTSAMQRLTIKGQSRFPIWSGDGEHIAFQSDREGDLAIFSQRAEPRNEILSTLIAGCNVPVANRQYVEMFCPVIFSAPMALAAR